MKETTAYRSEFLVIACPYCGEKIYLDAEDDMGEGQIPENGRKIRCDNQDCLRTFLLVNDISPSPLKREGKGGITNGYEL